MVTKDTSRAGYVYVMTTGNNRYKLGKTNNIERRKRELQTGNDNILQVIMYREFQDCKRAESTIHGIFGALRKHHEWFALSGADYRLLIKIFNPSQWTEEEKERFIRLGLNE